MSDKSKIIKFPSSRTKVKISHGEEGDHDFEAWECYQEYLDNEDYHSLVRYCEKRA